MVGTSSKVISNERLPASALLRISSPVAWGLALPSPPPQLTGQPLPQALLLTNWMPDIGCSAMQQSLTLRPSQRLWYERLSKTRTFESRPPCSEATTMPLPATSWTRLEYTSMSWVGSVQASR